jgi:hypothetical protein
LQIDYASVALVNSWTVHITMTGSLEDESVCP